MERNELTRSQFEEHEQLEEEEMEKRDKFHGESQEEVSRTSRGLGDMSMIQRIQQRNRSLLENEGPGYSKEPKKPSWKEDESS